jgi:hypothetical protein
MRLGEVEVDLPFELPTKEEIEAYKKKTERKFLLQEQQNLTAELDRLNKRLSKDPRDAYEITEQADLEDDVLGGR